MLVKHLERRLNGARMPSEAEQSSQRQESQIGLLQHLRRAGQGTSEASAHLAAMVPRMLTESYGEEPSQVGDVYLPEGAAGPTIVLVHGGFWYASFGRDLMAPLARDLAARGYVVWNIEYRRTGENGGGYPGTLADVSAATDHLATLATAHGFSTGHVVAIGHSAGGQLALWLAGRHHVQAGAPGHAPRIRVTAAAGQAPVADLARAYEMGLGDNAVGKWLGGGPDDVPERYKTASPRALLPLGVPQLVVHGDDDHRVPLEIANRYVDAARGLNDTVQFVVLPGANHFVHLDRGGEAWGTVLDWLGALVR